MSTSPEGRFHGLDWSRCLAIVAVVCIHVTDIAFRKNDYFQQATLEGAIYFALSACLRFCVPVFFIMSAFLIEKKTRGHSEPPQSRLKRYLFPLVVASVVYTLLAIAVAHAMNKPVSAPELLEAALTGHASVHTWYLVVAAIYVALHRWLRLLASGRRFPIVLGCYALLFALANGRIDAIGDSTYLRITLSHLIAAVPYYVSGIWLTHNLERVRSVPGAIVYAGLVVGIVVSGAWGILFRERNFYNPGALILSAALVAWAVKSTRAPPRIVRLVALQSLGIYLWHMVILIGVRALEGRYYRELISPYVTLAIELAEFAVALGGALLVALVLARDVRLRGLAQ